jgi:hypothetical protein
MSVSGERVTLFAFYCFGFSGRADSKVCTAVVGNIQVYKNLLKDSLVNVGGACYEAAFSSELARQLP